MPIAEPSEWREVLENLAQTRSLLLLGSTDTGKTTFLTWLANALHQQGRRVAIVDTDVGQSSLGPPTTIGLGIVAQPFRRLQELAPEKLYFVGSTSPRAHLLPVVVGTKRLVEQARALEVDHILIDTCGFVAPSVGQALKQAQTALVDPDMLVCFQRDKECESLLTAYRYRERPRLVRFRAATASRRRSMVERRSYRQKAWRQYFANAQQRRVPWEALMLVDTPLWRGQAYAVERYQRLLQDKACAILWAEVQDGELLVVSEEHFTADHVTVLEHAAGRRVHPWIASAFHGTLLALLNRAGEAQGLGILQDIDFSSRCLGILTPPCLGEIAGVQWSQTRLGSGTDLGREFSSRH